MIIYVSAFKRWPWYIYKWINLTVHAAYFNKANHYNVVNICMVFIYYLLTSLIKTYWTDRRLQLVVMRSSRPLCKGPIWLNPLTELFTLPVSGTITLLTCSEVNSALLSNKEPKSWVISYGRQNEPVWYMEFHCVTACSTATCTCIVFYTLS